MPSEKVREDGVGIMKKNIFRYFFNKKLLYLLIVLAIIDRIYYYGFPEIKAWYFQVVHSSPVHWKNVIIPYGGRLIYLESEDNITFTDAVGDPFGILVVIEIHGLDVKGLINKYTSDGYRLVSAEKSERWGAITITFQLDKEGELVIIHVLPEKKLAITYYGGNDGLRQFDELLNGIVVK